jgi:hypothetical protein
VAVLRMGVQFIVVRGTGLCFLVARSMVVFEGLQGVMMLPVLSQHSSRQPAALWSKCMGVVGDRVQVWASGTWDSALW